MKFEKTWFYYKLNGQRISKKLLVAIGEEIFTAKQWQGIVDELESTGYAERTIMPAHTARDICKENAELKAKLKQAG